VNSLSVLVSVGICVSGAVAAGQASWLAMDKLITRLGMEPIEWVQQRLGRDE
jgi:hypothetical protein